jgi:hypothetical protein
MNNITNLHISWFCVNKTKEIKRKEKSEIKTTTPRVLCKQNLKKQLEKSKTKI